MVNNRWLQPKNGRVKHLVDEERTGWEPGELAFRCGKTSDKSKLIETSTVRHCRACATWEGQ